MVNFSLEPSAAEMHASGERIAAMIVRAFEELPAQAAYRFRTSAQFAPFYEELPRQPQAWQHVIDRLEAEVLPYLARPSHPRFFAFVPGPSNWWGVWADAIARAYNVFAGCWFEGAGAAMIETVTTGWLLELAGYPESGCGAFMSGGSMANLTALAAARTWAFPNEQFEKGTVYFSDQTHSSVERALRLLGFRPDQLRKIPSDSNFRLPLDGLRASLKQDRANGLRPFCVVANGGTTNTGAVDPLEDIGVYAKEQGLWLHVDGAFGGAALLCAEGKRLLAGIEQSDSLSLDPHKWLFQPFDCGCVLFRDEHRARAAFAMTPEYLKDTMSTGEVNFWDYSPELTRPFRALKLWLSLQIFGADAFAAAIEHGFEMARLAEAELRAMPDWHMVTSAQMAILSFRYQRSDMSETEADIVNRKVGRTITESGFAVVLSTELRGRTVLRMCPINPRTTATDIRETLRELDRLARAF